MKLPDTKLLVIVTFIVAISAFAYGALTANVEPSTKQQDTTIETETGTPKPTQKDTETLKLSEEISAIHSLLSNKYPLTKTDYTITGEKLYRNQYYGAILIYHGRDNMNRDSLRVLMQKSDGEWKLLSTPPTIILSAPDYPSVPKPVLSDINRSVSLPGSDS